MEVQYQREINQIRDKAENSLNQLKQFYEIEKKSIERKLQSERQKINSYEKEVLGNLEYQQ